MAKLSTVFDQVNTSTMLPPTSGVLKRLLLDGQQRTTTPSVIPRQGAGSFAGEASAFNERYRDVDSEKLLFYASVRVEDGAHSGSTSPDSCVEVRSRPCGGSWESQIDLSSRVQVLLGGEAS